MRKQKPSLNNFVQNPPNLSTSQNFQAANLRPKPNFGQSHVSQESNQVYLSRHELNKSNNNSSQNFFIKNIPAQGTNSSLSRSPRIGSSYNYTVKPEVDRNHSISKSRNEYKKGSLHVEEEYFNKTEEFDAATGRDDHLRYLQNINNNSKRVQGHFRNESFGLGRPVGENPKQDYGQPPNLGQSVELPAGSVGPGLTKTVIEPSQSLGEPEKKFFWGEISQSMHLNTLAIQSKTAPAVSRELDKRMTLHSPNTGDHGEPLDETPIQRSSLN
jgi:hypothetical protein